MTNEEAREAMAYDLRVIATHWSGRKFIGRLVRESGLCLFSGEPLFYVRGVFVDDVRCDDRVEKLFTADKFVLDW